MQNYLIRRTLQSIPMLFFLSVILFLLVRAAPGGPLAQAERNPNISAQQLEVLRERLGLDQPLYIQYGKWMRGILLEGDLGNSIKSNRPVAKLIGERIPNTLLLVGTAFIITILVAIPLGALSRASNTLYSIMR